MSFPYPQDRHADRKTKGSQPYQDEKEAMTQTGARLQTEAEAWGETHLAESDEEREARVAAEVQDRLRQVNEEFAGRGNREG